MANSTVVADVSITVVDAACTVTHVAAGVVRCVTSSYGRTTRSNPGAGLVQLTIAGMGTAAATAEAHYEYIDLWSRVTTWGGSGPVSYTHLTLPTKA